MLSVVLEERPEITQSEIATADLLTTAETAEALSLGNERSFTKLMPYLFRLELTPWGANRSRFRFPRDYIEACIEPVEKAQLPLGIPGALEKFNDSEEARGLRGIAESMLEYAVNNAAKNGEITTQAMADILNMSTNATEGWTKRQDRNGRLMPSRRPHNLGPIYVPLKAFHLIYRWQPPITVAPELPFE